ncbi:hypothetical protein EUGRSUZ_F03553 [Eucalyptus grandis]|uniref:Uncharacterized protein n=2 Tax=Eucalyptus grandis TaxID=71139 RepID=A0ACC3KLU7_EUCGR|nr:hypothetical protein EUGRSUZ_F03553 [Eucalyptus grandis]
MFALHPPIPTRFPSTQLPNSPTLLRRRHLHLHLLLFPPLSSATSSSTAGAFATSDYSSPSTSPHLPPDFEELRRLEVGGDAARDGDGDGDGGDDDDVLSLQSRRYDFTPLLDFLSNSISSADSDSDPGSASPTSLDRAEFQLAESYRAVPAPLWHSLLKSLCSAPSSTGLAYAVVSWLQKHNLCFSYELLYSILIHALGRSEKLYEAFLLSQRQTLTPLTYNALIGACARNDDWRSPEFDVQNAPDGYQSDFVNYSLIIQSLTA